VSNSGLPAKLAQCCPESADERPQGAACSPLVRAEAFVGGHPAERCVPKRWIMLPRHYRRVSLAGHRAGFCDERGLCDDWVMMDLRTVRREALASGHHRDDVDAWTMEGCLRGRQSAREL
jgi:hypothetical protein